MQIELADLDLLGLNKTEFQVYSSLCEMGKAGAHFLAKRTGKKRTTVYSSLDSLMNKGLVSIEKGKSASIYSANRPESILREIEASKVVIKKKETVAREFITLISSLLETQNKNIPKIKYVEGKEGVMNFLDAGTPLWRHSVSEYDHTWWGYQDSIFVEEYRDWLNSYWQVKSSKERICLFSNYSEVEKQLKNKVSGREIRLLRDDVNFTSTIWVCGDYIIMIVARDKPHYAFQLYDKVFSLNLRLLFKALWGRESLIV